MDYLDSLRTFVAIADAGSLIGGARRRRVSAPTATRALASLEARLGAKLITRTTRSLRLTEAGQQFLAETRPALAALDAAEAGVTGRRARPEGLLSVTAPELFGERYIAPLVFEFLDAHPQVSVRALFGNRLVHLVDEGFDVALRIGRLPDSGMIAVPVGSMRVLLVAAPSYLARKGVPRAPSDLREHMAVALSIEGQEHIARDPLDRRRAKRNDSAVERLVVNTNSVKVAAAVAGQGIARALAYQVDREVRDGSLRILLSAHEPPAVPVHLIYPEGRASSAKVREFLALAVPRLRAMPLLAGKGLTAPRGAATATKSRG